MSEAKILEQLKELGKTAAPTFMATVKSVKEDFCSVKNVDGVLYPNVRLRANINDKNEGLLIVPSVGSTVLVSRIGDSDMLYVEMFSKIDHILFDGGENGGLTITPKLKSELDKLTARVDGIIDAITNAVPVSDQSGSGLQLSMVAGLELIVDKEDFSNIENKKIKH